MHWKKQSKQENKYEDQSRAARLYFFWKNCAGATGESVKE